MRNNIFIFFIIAALLLFPRLCLAMPPGTLLYRTGSNGKMFGYQGELIESAGGIITAVNAGHVAVYIGKIEGEDYIVEAISGGIVKTPAIYFLNRNENETFLGARIPRKLSPIQQAKVVAIAKNLAESDLAYDFDFHRQKGARSGDWTCVGLTEKIYESANISNPNNIGALEYDQRYYAMDITPDGYDNYSPANKDGDRFSKEKEFSQIARRTDLLFPFPEKIGYSAGLEKDGERYLFMPYTQFLQPSLETVPSDIVIYTSGSYAEVRGKTNWLAIGLRWSLINNPLSAIKNIVRKGENTVAAVKNILVGEAKKSSILLMEDKPASSSDQRVARTPAQITKNESSTQPALDQKHIDKKSVETISKPPLSSAPIKVSVVSKSSTSSPSRASIDELSYKSKATTPAQIVIYDPSQSKPTSQVVSSTTKIKNPDPGVKTNQEIMLAADALKVAQISGLYATGANDWVELYNPTDYDFDLASTGYRLEKTKGAEDPSIVMRIGNPQDGSYPGGTIIKSKGKYLIVRAEAGDYYKSRAQAIGTRTDFSWSDSGYTVYLGLGAISSSSDEDIVEAVGFGPDSRFFQGTAPALALTDNYVLTRTAYNNNNATDYSLVKSTDPAIVWSPPNLVSEDENEDEDLDSTESEEEAVVSEIPRIIINRLYATGNNDWIELYNPNDTPVDLSSAGYRLEKTRTADDPSLIMRIGNELDGTYPGGTTIGPQGTYKIVRASASAYHLEQADAVAFRTDYLWSGLDYSLYLGKGPISSSQDADIVDVIGFGSEARYFLGSGPAPAINDGFILSRQGNTNDNASDFTLVASDDPELTLNPGTGDEDEIDAGRYVFPTPTLSPGLVNIWHFDDCYGPGKRVVGKFDCAIDLGVAGDFVSNLEPTVDVDQFSIAFYYKRNSQYSRLRLDIGNEGSDNLALVLELDLATLEGFPSSAYRYSQLLPFDDSWHQAAIVIDQANDYWAVYIDGEKIIHQAFMANLPVMSTIDFNGEDSSTLVDEIAVWHRSLSETEIRNNYLLNAPYYPIASRSPQKQPELIHFWQFEEDTGTSTLDAIGAAVMSLDPAQWSARVHDNYAISTAYNRPVTANLNIPLDEREISIAFWWKNSAFPSEGRADIMLLSDFEERKLILGLEANYYRAGYFFNGAYSILAQGLGEAFPNDDSWHHVAFVYDSYRYRLSLYIDGEEVAHSYHVWLPADLVIKGLEISTLFYPVILDDFMIYKGALNIEDIRAIYNNTREN